MKIKLAELADKLDSKYSLPNWRLVYQTPGWSGSHQVPARQLAGKFEFNCRRQFRFIWLDGPPVQKGIQFRIPFHFYMNLEHLKLND
jgi:hypothetical protein